MTEVAVASDPVFLATLDRLWAVLAERGLTLADLSVVSARVVERLRALEVPIEP